MKEWLVVIERAGSNFSAYVPDLPGCVTTGATVDETEANIREAIQLYVETMRQRGERVPEPTSLARGVAAAG